MIHNYQINRLAFIFSDDNIIGLFINGIIYCAVQPKLRNTILKLNFYTQIHLAASAEQEYRIIASIITPPESHNIYPVS